MTEGARHSRVLLDTGPLVAVLSRRDSRHAECVDTLKRIDPPLLTCWPVLTEAAWLLRLDARAVQRLLLSGKVGLFRLLEISHNELPEIERLRKRYVDLPPQLADLAIIHLAHREETDTIFSLDRRDFSVFRYKVRSRFKLLPEEK